MVKNPRSSTRKIDSDGPTACACANLRRAARAATQSYDAVLAPSGLSISQFGILATLDGLGPLAVTRLAVTLDVDRTTLTRNLKPLTKSKLVTLTEGEDRRSRVVTLTKKGRAALTRALPLWQEAQNRFVESYGKSNWTQLRKNLRTATAVAHDLYQSHKED